MIMMKQKGVSANMCTFITKLPERTKSSISNIQNLFLAMKPTEKQEDFYRFRIIGTTNKSIGRDYPFIERYTHTKWTKNENGKAVIESQVVCPATPYMKSFGSDVSKCPICNFSNLNFKSYMESGKRDKESMRKGNDFRKKFEALIPVFVVNDPVYPGNNNRFKVIAFDDNHRKDYEKLCRLIKIETEDKGNNVFNSKNAVDLCIRFERVSKKINEGTPREYVFSTNEVKFMKFSNKPRNIEAITDEKQESFIQQFEDQYFIKSSTSDLNNYYNKYCKVKMDDVDFPEDTPAEPELESSNVVEKKAEPIRKIMVEPKITVENKASSVSSKMKQPTNDEETDAELSALLADIGSDDDEEESQPVVEKKKSSAKKIEQKKTTEDDSDLLSLDDFNIDDI